MTNGIAGNVVNLVWCIAKTYQGLRNNTVDDFEVTTTSQFLEFYNCKVWFNPCGVTIHD